MFKAVLSDVDLLKSSIPIIAEIIDEGLFNIDQNGISLLSPDRTMVSVVDLKILSTAFDEFKVEGKEALGLNLASLAAVLKRAKSSSRIILESGKGRLKIKVEGNGVRTFEIPLLEVKTEKPPIEQLNFAGLVELESAVIEDGIADAEIVSDAVIFSAEPESFKMSAKGDITSTELEMKKGDPGLLKLQVKSPMKAQYPLDYLKKMIKMAKMSKQLMLEFGTDYPLRLNFKAIDKMQVRFILAPRISE